MDTSGNAYVSGYLGGTAFVDKLNPSGSAVLYSTLIAGGTTPGLDMALDSAGNVYLAGTTLSSSFPFTANAYQSSCNPGDIANCSPEGDAFVVKLNTNGVPVYSSYLGGSDGDQGIAVAADNSGKVYVTGITASTTFPTKTPIQSCAANGNIFVTKIDTTLSGVNSLVYSTCLGGNGADWGNDIAIDASGSAFIAGWSTSTDFTTTSGVIRPTHTTSEGEGVVVKLNAAGTARTYATYLGGNGYDSAEGIALDSSGNAYLTGATFSTDLPHPNGYQIACAGGCSGGDSYVLVLNATATTVSYGTYLGGAGADAGTSIALDNQNIVYATGFAGANFPVTPDRLYGTGTSYASNAYLTKLNPTEVGADSMVYATYLGGNDYVNARAIAVDAGSNAYVTGETEATNLGIAGAVQVNFSGDPASDVFVLKVNAAQRLTRYSYDGLQRLIGANERPGSVYTYTYDLAGNRTAVQLNGGTPTVTTYNAANQITNAGFTYDNAGNLINDGTVASTYDALNRTTVRGGTTYAYNGDGTLVSQATSGVTTRYTQDLAAPLSQVLQTQVGAGARTDYLYGLNRLASLQSGVKTWYAADALGSVRRTVTDAGVPLGVINYDPWGTVESGTVPTFGFTGEVQDVSSGLVNLRARWYSTGRGRFTSVDPYAGMPETPYSLHQYQYGYSDPVLNTDPSGKIVPACPIGYRKVFKDGQFAGCEDDPDFPSWLGFLKGSLGPMPIGATAVGGTLPQLGGEAAKQALGKTLEVCAALFTYLGLQALSDTQAQTQRRQPQRNVVELGPGILPDNLVTLAAFYPNANIYGIEQDAGSAMGAEFMVQQLNLSSRIQIIKDSYATYKGHLQNNADIVVAVEPSRWAPVVDGIRNLIKPGGTVLVITEFYAVRDEVIAAAGGKAQIRQLSSIDATGVYAPVQVMQSSLGVPLVSQFTRGHTPWEIYVPSW